MKPGDLDDVKRYVFGPLCLEQTIDVMTPLRLARVTRTACRTGYHVPKLILIAKQEAEGTQKHGTYKAQITSFDGQEEKMIRSNTLSSLRIV